MKVRNGYILTLFEGKLTAVSPVDGGERELSAPTIWTMRSGDPWTFRTDAETVFALAVGADMPRTEA